jgi:hypothetical protein
LGGKSGDGVAFFCGIAAVKADGVGDKGGPLAEAVGGIEDDQAGFGVGCLGYCLRRIARIWIADCREKLLFNW